MWNMRFTDSRKAENMTAGRIQWRMAMGVLLDFFIQLFWELLPRFLAGLARRVRSIYRSSMGKDPMPHLTAPANPPGSPTAHPAPRKRSAAKY